MNIYNRLFLLVVLTLKLFHFIFCIFCGGRGRHMSEHKSGSQATT